MLPKELFTKKKTLQNGNEFPNGERHTRTHTEMNKHTLNTEKTLFDVEILRFYMQHTHTTVHAQTVHKYTNSHRHTHAHARAHTHIHTHTAYLPVQQRHCLM